MSDLQFLGVLALVSIVIPVAFVVAIIYLIRHEPDEEDESDAR